MNARRIVVVVACFCSFGIADVSADTAADVAPGSRLRVWAPTFDDSPIVGSLVALDDRTLILHRENAADPVEVPRDAVRILRVSTGRHSRGHGAWKGAVFGTVAGLAAGLIHGRDKSGDSGLTWGIAYAVAGAPTGAIIGLALPPSERWQRVALSPAPRHRTALSLRLRF